MTPMGTDQGEAAPTSRRKLVLTFILFMLLILFEAMDNNAFGPVMPQIRDEFGLSATQLGLYAGLGSLFGLLTAVPIGELIRRTGFRFAGTAMVVVIAIGSGMSFLAAGFAILVAGRAIVTTGTRGSLLVAQAGGTTVAPSKMRSTAWALLNSMISVGGALGAVVLGGYVGSHYGWRAVMLTMLVASIVIAVIYAAFLRVPEPAETPIEAAAGETASIYRNWPIYALGVACALTLSGLIVNSTFSAVVLKDRWDLGTQFAGNAIGIGQIASFPCLFLAGAIADRLQRRRPVLSVLILCGIAGPLVQLAALGLSVDAGGPTLFIVGLVLCYIAGVAGGALFYAAVPDLVAKGTNLGPVYGLLTVVSTPGWFIEPILAGALRDLTGSFAAVFALFGLGGAISLAIIWMIKIR